MKATITSQTTMLTSPKETCPYEEDNPKAVLSVLKWVVCVLYIATGAPNQVTVHVWKHKDGELLHIFYGTPDEVRRQVLEVIEDDRADDEDWLEDQFFGKL